MLITNISDNDYPKTLHIRNQSAGMIWQIYHVENLKEAKFLSHNALRNGFMESTLVDHTDQEQTFPNWRQECQLTNKTI